MNDSPSNVANETAAGRHRGGQALREIAAPGIRAHQASALRAVNQPVARERHQGEESDDSGLDERGEVLVVDKEVGLREERVEPAAEPRVLRRYRAPPLRTRRSRDRLLWSVPSRPKSAVKLLTRLGLTSHARARHG